MDNPSHRERAQASKAIRPVSFAIDPIAEAALRRERAEVGAAELRCDACDGPVDGESSGRGLYMWSRGDEVRFEEPALCEACATAIGVTALTQWDLEEEEG